MSPKKNSPACSKVYFFSSWTINGPAIPILGCIVYHRIAAGAPLHHIRKAPPKRGLGLSLRRRRKETPQTIDFPGIVARKAPLRSGAKEGQSARGLSFRAARTTRESRHGSGSTQRVESDSEADA